MNSVWAIVPAAGSGSRMAAEVPKQYLEIAGIPLLEYSLRALLACPDIRAIVVVLDPADRRADGLPSLQDPRVLRAPGGAERADSVLSGLQQIEDQVTDLDWALVHDAARPCVPVTAVKRLIDRVSGTGTGGLLAVPCNDTIKSRGEDGLVERTLDRRLLWRAQTPQMFPFQALRQALEQARADGVTVTDEASAMERAGYPVQIVPGPECNIKVTVPEDLAMAGLYLDSQQGERR